MTETHIHYESKLIQLQSIDSHRDFNTIYSVKIKYRGPNVGICSKPFHLAAARKKICFSAAQAIAIIACPLQGCSWWKESQILLQRYLQRESPNSFESWYISHIHVCNQIFNSNIIQLIIERTWVEIGCPSFVVNGARNCFVHIRCTRMFVQLLNGLLRFASKRSIVSCQNVVLKSSTRDSWISLDRLHIVTTEKQTVLEVYTTLQCIRASLSAVCTM